MLDDVEWGDYKIKELFESENGDFDIQKEHIDNKGNFVITSGITNNGILGKSSIPAKIFSKNTITIDMFGYAFYRKFDYKMVTHARVFSLKPKFDVTENQGLFLANAFHFLHYYFGYENMCSWAKIKNKKIVLPEKNGKIDFEFMELFIYKLKQQRNNELEDYLLKSGLSNTNFTDDEMNFLNIKNDNDKLNIAELLNQKEWKYYKMGDLFERIKTNKLPYKAKELPTTPTDTNPLPCLTSSFMNQGLNYYVPKENATILKNVISIPSNSDVYRAYYQSLDFTVLSDAYAIKWKNDNDKITGNQYLFLVSCINKFTDLPIYSYKNKLGGWNVVKNKNILLPVKDGKIDFDFMEKVVMILKKIIIKDVVLYTGNANNKNSMKFERKEK